MRLFGAGLLVGVVLATACFGVFWVSQRHPQWKQGHYHGTIAGRFEAVDALEKEFGRYQGERRYDGKSPYKVIFSVKTTEVVSIETNGVKTVRVIP